jgi:hypothetical protein
VDKYEYQLKLSEILKLADEKKYEDAAKIAQTINWRKVRSTSTLCRIGEIMGKAEKFKEGKEILLMAYDRSPIGRNIISQLVELCIQEGTLEEAEEYYGEFVEIAPRDNKRYEMRYRLDKLKGASIEDLIGVLEEYKEREFSEEWAYELAYLYHQAGRGEQCVELCDDIILWFGEGSFVEKAMELKMLYEPLTPEQARQYEDCKMYKEGYTVVHSDEVFNTEGVVKEAMNIPTIEPNINRFSTTNLQQEVAKGMQQIMDATEKEEVTSTMNTLHKLVEESSLPIMDTVTRQKDETRIEEIEDEELIDASLQLNFAEILREDTDGQISMDVPQASLESQITGQMSIQEILGEWERTKRAAEIALEEASRQKLESAKVRALAQAEDIMDRLQDVLPTADSERVVPEEQPSDPQAHEERLQKEQMQEPQKEEPKQEEEPVTKTQPETISEEKAEESPWEQQVTRRLSTKKIPLYEKAILAQLEVEEPKEEKAPVMEFSSLSEEQKEIFSYFIPVSGMEQQICEALQGAINHDDLTSETGNLLIEGGRHSGKTMLATNLITLLQDIMPRESAKIGKITADSLNTKSPHEVLSKVYGGYLIIENAGALTVSTARKLSVAMEEDTGGLMVIMEGTRSEMKSVLVKDTQLAKKFTGRIRIPIFTSDELVTFARAYAKEQMYRIDEMGILALYNRIGNIQKADRATTLTEVKEIIDAAIARSKKGGLRNLFKKRATQGGYTILFERDFQ